MEVLMFYFLTLIYVDGQLMASQVHNFRELPKCESILRFNSKIADELNEKNRQTDYDVVWKVDTKCSSRKEV